MALDIHARAEFVNRLRTIWDAGDAVLPIDLSAPRAHVESILHSMAPSAVIDAGGDRVRLKGGVPVEDGDAVVITTSGTTGTPKGVIHTHDSMAAASRITAEATRTTPDSHWLACLPLAHIGGFSVITRALHAQAGLTVTDGFNADDFVSVARSGGTHVSLVPTVLGRVSVTGWELVLLGGSSIPDDRPPNCVATYGMTETFGGVVYDEMPLAGVDVRTDAHGVMMIRSPSLFRGYRDPGGLTTPAPIDDDGFYPSGDVGSVDPFGRVTVDGRSDDLIISGGVKIWPEPLERVICGHPSVHECAVVGSPDPEWGQRVVAVVVSESPTDMPTLDSIRDLVKATMPAASAPKELVITDTLPKTSSGKIRRRLAVQVDIEPPSGGSHHSNDS